MTIHEYGKSNAKTVVLVHPSVVMWDFFRISNSFIGKGLSCNYSGIAGI